MKIIQSLPFLFAWLSAALADIEFTDPPAGAIIQGNHVITAHWKDSGRDPRLSDLTKYDLYLCAGGDKSGTYEEVAVLMSSISFARGNSVSFQVDPEVGGSEDNAYFLKMVSMGPNSVVTNFSKRFTLQGMTGSFSSRVQSGILSITDTDGPGNKDGTKHIDLRKRQNTGQYTVAYEYQTGLTRYAPMAKKPGTTITAKTASRQYPTSSYSLATTYLSAATIVTTLSASETYSTSSIENTASAAGQPTATSDSDKKMKRWLERWQD
ncbi:hypothetical protein ASPZODRAFT_126321 [Penicilliopsis zonata CBS 506.65]|uniref:Uncharacterized protein n=1 Tax=Penicilliopsis zonata CBS 506.65 TaxID=1073090 RepID=A0A1L9STJ6_9EURO|nr:hypothetical protein ASPZODRAFT_126321 [Penicilliopsis zonata CBS 506.65]OJJ50456.1 hypothetical protein ASPZODRAFT_126321 [Penicilliopsis zonata CBS 506.65]